MQAFISIRSGNQELDNQLFKEVVGHCNTPNDVLYYKEAKDYVLSTDRRIDNLRDMKNFNNYYMKHKNENSDLTNLKRSFEIEFDDKKDETENIIVTFMQELINKSNNTFTREMLEEVRNKQSLNTKQFLTYLEGENLYLDYKKYLFPSEPQTFKDYINQHGGKFSKRITSITSY